MAKSAHKKKINSIKKSRLVTFRRKLSRSFENCINNTKDVDSPSQEKCKDEISELLNLSSASEFNSQTIKTELIDISNVESFDGIPLEHNTDPFIHFNDTTVSETALSLADTNDKFNNSKSININTEQPSDPLDISEDFSKNFYTNIKNKQDTPKNKKSKSKQKTSSKQDDKYCLYNARSVTDQLDESILQYIAGLKAATQKRKTILEKEAISEINASFNLLEKSEINIEDSITEPSSCDEMNDIRIEWTPHLTCQFIKILMELTSNENVQPLKYAVISDAVWGKMGKKMNIKKNTLKHFWNHSLYMQLFCEETISLNEIKIKIIKYMYKHQISSPNVICWKEVRSIMNGITEDFFYEIFISLHNEAIQKIKKSKFSAIIKYLYTKKIPQLQDSSEDKALPRIMNLDDFMSKYEKSITNEE